MNDLAQDISETGRQPIDLSEAGASIGGVRISLTLGENSGIVEARDNALETGESIVDTYSSGSKTNPLKIGLDDRALALFPLQSKGPFQGIKLWLDPSATLAIANLGESSASYNTGVGYYRLLNPNTELSPLYFSAELGNAYTTARQDNAETEALDLVGKTTSLINGGLALSFFEQDTHVTGTGKPLFQVKWSFDALTLPQLLNPNTGWKDKSKFSSSFAVPFGENRFAASGGASYTRGRREITATADDLAVGQANFETEMDSGDYVSADPLDYDGTTFVDQGYTGSLGFTTLVAGQSVSLRGSLAWVDQMDPEFNIGTPYSDLWSISAKWGGLYKWLGAPDTKNSVRAALEDRQPFTLSATYSEGDSSVLGAGTDIMSGGDVLASNWSIAENGNFASDDENLAFVHRRTDTHTQKLDLAARLQYNLDASTFARWGWAFRADAKWTYDFEKEQEIASKNQVLPWHLGGSIALTPRAPEGPYKSRDEADVADMVQGSTKDARMELREYSPEVLGVDVSGISSKTASTYGITRAQYAVSDDAVNADIRVLDFKPKLGGLYRTIDAWDPAANSYVAIYNENFDPARYGLDVEDLIADAGEVARLQAEPVPSVRYSDPVYIAAYDAAIEDALDAETQDQLADRKQLVRMDLEEKQMMVVLAQYQQAEIDRLKDERALALATQASDYMSKQSGLIWSAGVLDSVTKRAEAVGLPTRAENVVAFIEATHYLMSQGTDYKGLQKFCKANGYDHLEVATAYRDLMADHTKAQGENVDKIKELRNAAKNAVDAYLGALKKHDEDIWDQVKSELSDLKYRHEDRAEREAAQADYIAGLSASGDADVDKAAADAVKALRAQDAKRKEAAKIDYYYSIDDKAFYSNALQYILDHSGVNNFADLTEVSEGRKTKLASMVANYTTAKAFITKNDKVEALKGDFGTAVEFGNLHQSVVQSYGELFGRDNPHFVGFSSDELVMATAYVKQNGRSDFEAMLKDFGIEGEVSARKYTKKVEPLLAKEASGTLEPEEKQYLFALRMQALQKELVTYTESYEASLEG